MAVEAVLFWKLGFSRGMLAAMEEQTKQEQFRMLSELYRDEKDDDDEEQ
jgi:hypothetical protein